jgi:hypothetical protein
MYGTVTRVRPKAQAREQLEVFQREWLRERKPKVPGAIASYVVLHEGDDATVVAIFADKASYQANAADPEQDRWYRRFRELIENDPVWEDGEIVG